MSKDRAAQLVEAGIWLKLSGDREGARKLFERALKLDPGNEKAEQLLAGGPAPGENDVAPPQARAVPPPPTVAASPVGTNPFERPEHSTPGPAESDWGLATGFKTNLTPEPSLAGGWGRLTGASTPVPQHPPATVSPADSGPAGTSSNVVLGGAPPSLAPSAPASRATMQFFNSPAATQEPAPRTTLRFFTPLGAADAPAPKATLHLFSPSAPAEPPAPRTTMQFFNTPGAAAEPPPPAPARETLQLFGPATSPAPRDTTQLFGTQQPQTVEIGGSAGPEVPPPSTPPLFGYGEPAQNPAGSLSVTIGGEPGRDSPVPSTPPLFSAPAAVELPGSARTTTDPMGYAWAWASTSPPPRTSDPELPPEPRPSPSLAPRAESAWDHRSNPGIKLEAVVGQDRALDLITSDSRAMKSPEAQKEEIRAILRGARDLLDLDDHSGAMELIVKAQTMAPDDPDVLSMRERSEKTLLNMFESKLGKMETIPRVLLKDDEIIWLNLDHRAGFVLAQIDGTVSFDDLFSVSGMSRIDTARILAQLVEEGVISRG